MQILRAIEFFFKRCGGPLQSTPGPLVSRRNKNAQRVFDKSFITYLGIVRRRSRQTAVRLCFGLIIFIILPMLRACDLVWSMGGGVIRSPPSPFLTCPAVCSDKGSGVFCFCAALSKTKIGYICPTPFKIEGVQVLV